MSEIKKRILYLREKIEKANREYHTLDDPEISDYEYDMLFSELVRLEEENPEYKTPTSPTNKIGDKPLSEFKKYSHPEPMMSLSNLFSLDEAGKFCNDTKEKINEYQFLLQEKLDGIAISVDYKDGKYNLAATRGDGFIGEDVTMNVKTIKSLPLKLKDNINITIRGEIVMPKKSFLLVNKEKISNGEEPFKNPRNAASGTIRQLDSKIVAKRNLDIIFYNIVDPKKFNLKTETEVLDFLNLQGLKTPINTFLVKSKEMLIKKISEIENLKNDLPYEIDGVVIKTNNIQKGLSLGKTEKYPKNYSAYKFKPDMALTKLESISYQVGRLGTITPVANLTPILLNGSLISRATLHNFSYIIEKDIREGDMVYIYKAGEIIPKVDRVDITKRKSNPKKYEPPKKCFSCDTPLNIDKNSLISFCPNNNCPERIIASIIFFTSKSAMDITGLGDRNVRILYEKGLLNNIYDLYNLENKKDEIKKIHRFGSSNKKDEDSLKVENLITSIKKSKEKPFKNLLYAIGIPNVGYKLSKILASKYENIDNLINASYESLKNTDGIGDEIANSIISYFKDSNNLKLISYFKDNNFNLENKKIKKGPLLGLNIVVSGTLLNYSRKSIEEDLEKNGAVFEKNVTKKTNYLLLGEKPGSSKIAKAKEDGIKIITEEEYEKLKKQ